jgi:aspartate racemase
MDTNQQPTKVIGMIGGMSWESTAEYYRLANVLVRERLGGLHSARCIIVSVDFAGIERLQTQDRWDEAGLLLAKTAQTLESAGADVLLICTNTMHIVADQVQAAVSIPLLHIADVTARAVTAQSLTTVGFLGTRFTMDRSFYRARLEGHGLRVLLPSKADRETIHRIIYDELCVGVLSGESREAYRDIIRRLISNGAQGIILGCTEIELLVSELDSPAPVFPTTRLHVAAAVDAVCGLNGQEPSDERAGEPPFNIRV